MAIKPELLIEASLFSAGKPISVKELSENLEFTEDDVKKHLKKLMATYKRKESALEISKVGNKYSMQVRPKLASHVKSLAEMEIPAKVLKTAALIAYHQPIKQSDLQEMFGSKVYDHVKVLAELGLLNRRYSGRTIILTTTPQFAEYFGIESTDKDKIKKWLSSKVQKLEQQEIEVKFEEPKKKE